MSVQAAAPARSSRARRAGQPAPRAGPVDPVALLSPRTRALLDEFRLEDVASHLIRRAHFLAEELFSREFGAESITPRQKAALVILLQHPGLNQNALSDKLFMDRNTVAEMVRRLVQRGLVLRTPAAEDQRAYELSVSAEGAALIDRVLPRDVELEHELLARLPQEYRPLFIKCLRLMVDADSTRMAPE